MVQSEKVKKYLALKGKFSPDERRKLLESMTKDEIRSIAETIPGNVGKAAFMGYWGKGKK